MWYFGCSYGLLISPSFNVSFFYPCMFSSTISLLTSWWKVKSKPKNVKPFVLQHALSIASQVHIVLKFRFSQVQFWKVDVAIPLYGRHLYTPMPGSTCIWRLPLWQALEERSRRPAGLQRWIGVEEKNPSCLRGLLKEHRNVGADQGEL